LRPAAETRRIEVTETVNPLSAALAALAVVLFATALLMMAADRLAVAGFCFLSASLVIYLRETRPPGGTAAD